VGGMFNKSFLIEEIVKSLVSHGFSVFSGQGCFDIVAKKKFLMLIKALTNVDGLSEEHAQSIRAISYFISAYPLVVSRRTSRCSLSDSVIYSRFQLPVVTPKMFSIIVEDAVPEIKSVRGKHTVTINTSYLREKRQELSMSLQNLSERIGVSKKALYEIENQRVNPSVETVKKLEELFGAELKKSYELKYAEATYLLPETEFEHKISSELSRIGMDNTTVRHAPFNIVGREKKSWITGLSVSVTGIKENAGFIKKLSSIFSSRAVFITKGCEEQSVEGVPVVLESELPEIETFKELNRLIKEKE
jgi:putative transcriptional regulator